MIGVLAKTGVGNEDKVVRCLEGGVKKGRKRVQHQMQGALGRANCVTVTSGEGPLAAQTPFKFEP